MKKMIAVTGGIGSGKSSVLACLAEMGYPIFSCDEIYKEVIQSPAYLQKISEVFPQCIIEGKIDKKILAKIVFQNKEKLAILNGIAHPLIMDSLFKSMHICESALVFAEVPLLFEGNYENQFDKVIVVLRDKEERVRSIMARDNVTQEDALNRIAVQFDYDNAENRFKNCNAILIKNNGSFFDLKSKISIIVKQLL